MIKIVRKYLPKQSKISPALTAGIWFTVCNILQRGIQFLTTPIYTRILTSEQYGYYSVFLTWCNITLIIAALSLPNTPYYNGMIKYKKDGYIYTSSLQLLGNVSTLIFAAIFTMLYPIIGSIIGLPYKFSVLMFVVAFFNPAFLFWSYQQRLEYKYKALIIATVINSLLMPLIGITLVIVFGFGYEGLIYGYVFSIVIVGGLFYIKNLYRGHCRGKKEYCQYALKISAPLIPHYLSQIILGQSDRVMINYYCGAGDAGIYSLAYQVSLVMTILTTGINNALTPWFYRAFKKREYDKIRKTINTLTIVVATVSGIAMLVAPEIVCILGTKEYLKAVWVIPPVVFATCFSFAYGLWGTVLFCFEKSKQIAFASIFGALLNVLLNAMLIPKIGFIVAAYTTVTGYIGISICIYYFSKRTCASHNICFGEIYDLHTFKLIIYGLVCITVISLALYNFNSLVRYLIIMVVLIALFFKREPLINTLRTIMLKE
ncbi:MAG: oligosaccharide flippase family protein [Lachnospiraceae bacterium]|nr:oligosaccharide flippase family protein [Lachnospiraceae bacterium]